MAEQSKFFIEKSIEVRMVSSTDAEMRLVAFADQLLRHIDEGKTKNETELCLSIQMYPKALVNQWLIIHLMSI